MSTSSRAFFCLLLCIFFFSYQFYLVKRVSNTLRPYRSKNAAIHVLIISTWRSGSSFLGQIFNHHPDVFYLFEPGHPVWMRFRNEGAAVLHYPVRDLIHSLFTCDVTPLQHYWGRRRENANQMKFLRALCSPCSLPTLPEGYNHSNCHEECKNSTFENMTKTCDTYSHRVMKTVRILDFSVLLPLFRDPALDLRIIHLVRDPRAIASSRRFFILDQEDQIVKEHDNSTKTSLMSKICRAQANIYRAATADNYLARRHEDLARDPIVNVKKIYGFSSLEMTKDLEEWVHNVTHVHANDENVFMSFSRQSTKVIQQWRETLDFKEVKEIEENCKEAMDLFGYLPVTSKRDQKKMNLNFFFMTRGGVLQVI
ncbi:carbohydrate sulfotransferase 4-like [Engystomops pustulosus]|uniref:carbohydrate sulfotransferase 4-like n=1 Tax=Engystomops pustulosus TaxID=76066 RepID=UPI003AFA923B